jgi:farnesyl-diphosphate farnesyltransferase
MAHSAYLLRHLLKEVSRSFYLTLRVLPGSIRPQIGLAYLLARANDTVADTELVSVDERLAVLRRLRERSLGATTERLDLTRFLTTQPQENPSERVLLERIEDALGLLASFDAADQQRIKDVLSTIIGGQELDLTRFGAASVKNIIALQTGEELDDYTYRVAGCVGEFWTRMCLAHLFARNRLDEQQLLRNGVRFGKGLQLVNVLRDVPRDLRQGRCYLPADELGKSGLKPTDLLDPANETRVRQTYDRWLDVAHAHLAAGWEYTNALPRNQFRIRLACAWPILIGKETLQGLANGRVLDPSHPIKISRAKVRQIVMRSLLLYPFAARWQGLFNGASGRQRD